MSTQFDHYDANMAAGILANHAQIAGLPGYLGIRADEIDILVDLNGLTKGARPAILRQKPAPMQVTYLGYIGPVSLPELDYLICDAVTIPEEMDAEYKPRPLRGLLARQQASLLAR